MSSRFNDLPAEAQDRFWKTVARWGLQSSQVIKRIETARIGPVAHISANAEVTHVPTVPIRIESIEHMKELGGGISDRHYLSGKMSDRAVRYPVALRAGAVRALEVAPHACWFKDRLTPEDHDVLGRAYWAYLVGNSQKIDPGAVRAINAVHFPTTVHAAAAEEIIVAAGTEKVFGEGSNEKIALVVGALVIEPGASIRFAVETTIDGQACQIDPPSTRTLVSMAGIRPLPAMRDAPPSPPANNIKLFAPAPAKPQTPGPQGSRGKAGGATGGAQGPRSNKDSTMVCNTPSQPATDGDIGYTGTTGTDGSNGVKPPSVVLKFGTIDGHLSILAGGGDGGDGGDGGQGGAGGTGGDGIGNQGACANQKPGMGGRGGDGGPGGLPGDAVDGSSALITYVSAGSSFSYSIQTVGGIGGKPGNGGDSGQPGAGGEDPAGVIPNYNKAAYNKGTGKRGDTGNGGKPGKNGLPGDVQVKQVSASL